MMLADVQIHQWYWCKLRHGVTLMACVEAGDGYLVLRDPKTDIKYRLRPDEIISKAKPPVTLWEKMQSLWHRAGDKFAGT